ncbi:MAG TPA: UDP-4-amino-4,6-dideoxy-N-acetyl-beta-L-altrosamine transaminase [Candidatus Paceibacterota bacterium]
MIPYGKQSLDESDYESVAKVLRGDWLTQGPTVKEFESELARVSGARFAVAVSSGTAALHIAYLTAGIGKDHEVITTTNTFVATSNMLLAVGAKPVFCDIDPVMHNIDTKQIEKLITKRTRAIVPVHYSGLPCDMDEILKIARKHKLIVIEDACHALGSAYKGKPIGSLKSDMAVFSFHPVKAITTGEGGAIVTNSKKYYEKLLLLRSHGITKDKAGFNSMIELGYNYRLTDIQAALGLSQIKKLDKFISTRRMIASRYKQALQNLPNIILPGEQANRLSAWHLYPIALTGKILGKQHEVINKLREQGIGAQWHYPAVYLHPYYRKLGYKKGLCPVAEEFCGNEISLPIFPSLTLRDQDKVIKVLTAFVKCIGGPMNRTALNRN